MTSGAVTARHAPNCHERLNGARLGLSKDRIRHESIDGTAFEHVISETHSKAIPYELHSANLAELQGEVIAKAKGFTSAASDELHPDLAKQQGEDRAKAWAPSLVASVHPYNLEAASVSKHNASLTSNTFQLHAVDHASATRRRPTLCSSHCTARGVRTR